MVIDIALPSVALIAILAICELYTNDHVMV